jgi:hypothetical protein
MMSSPVIASEAKQSMAADEAMDRHGGEGRLAMTAGMEQSETA